MIELNRGLLYELDDTGKLLILICVMVCVGIWLLGVLVDLIKNNK